MKTHLSKCRCCCCCCYLFCCCCCCCCFLLLLFWFLFFGGGFVGFFFFFFVSFFFCFFFFFCLFCFVFRVVISDMSSFFRWVRLPRLLLFKSRVFSAEPNLHWAYTTPTAGAGILAPALRLQSYSLRFGLHLVRIYSSACVTCYQGSSFSKCRLLISFSFSFHNPVQNVKIKMLFGLISIDWVQTVCGRHEGLHVWYREYIISFYNVDVYFGKEFMRSWTRRSF